MDTSAGTADSPRIAVLGSHSAFTEIAVGTLCESGIAPVALVTGPAPAPAARGPIPIESCTSAAHGPVPLDIRTPAARGSIPLEIRTPAARHASMHGIARIQVPDPNHPDSIAALERVEPDILLLACLPHVVGRATRRTARLGALNLHPSALPRFRGPSPVFWQLRAGIVRAGVTAHVATDTVDAGPIVVQRSIEVRPGIGASALTEALVRCGTRALVDVLPGIERRIRGATPQDESAATSQPHPRIEDFRLDTSWSAERAYRFIEGARGPAATFTVATGEGEIEIVRAIGFGNRARTGPKRSDRPERPKGPEQPGEPEQPKGPKRPQPEETVTIRFADGVLRAVPA